MLRDRHAGMRALPGKRSSIDIRVLSRYDSPRCDESVHPIRPVANRGYREACRPGWPLRCSKMRRPRLGDIQAINQVSSNIVHPPLIKPVGFFFLRPKSAAVPMTADRLHGSMTTEQSGVGRKTPRVLVLMAFAAIYLIWGSTYLAIRFAVETLPPFLMGAARFIMAGSALYGFLRWRGLPAPSRADWRTAGVSGLLLLGLGNGGVNWAEQKVPSSLAALIIAGTPIWFAVFEWLRPGGVRPTRRTVLGILVGFAGVTVLISNGRHEHSGDANFVGVLALMAASVAWAGGSLYAKYSKRTSSTIMTAAQQMITGGIIMLVIGLTAGETAAFHWTIVSGKSVWAFAYLTVVGSLVGFTAYAWLLNVTTPAKVSTYAYVNPVIAVLLGCLVGGEVLTASMVAAAGIIVFAVVVLTSR